MTNRALLALGLGQCVNWGVLYYAFSAWLLPIEQDVRAPRWVITGAFSVALLLSAAAAPLVGRLGDRGHGPALIRFGGLAAAALLATWAALPGVIALYVLWAALGVCMAATLYEPAFVVVGRAVADPAERLRALALVTLVGGLASTVFLPLTGFLVTVAGWRGSVAILAVVLGASTAATQLLAFRGLSPVDAGSRRAPVTVGPIPPRPPLWLLVTFGFGSLASTAVIANLVPALVAGSLSPPGAAALGGLFGVMQLPGRALLFHGRLRASPRHLLVVSLALQAAGLVCWAATTGAVGPTLGLAVFAIGSGLSTLVRPFIVQSLFGSAAGRANGRLAQVQHLARGIGPIVGAWVAAGAGYGLLLAGFGVAFVFLAVLAALSESKICASDR